MSVLSEIQSRRNISVRFKADSLQNLYLSDENVARFTRDR